MSNIAFDNVVAQDHTDRFTIRKMLGQSERIGNPARAILVGVIEPLETEIFAVTQQSQKISRAVAACD